MSVQESVYLEAIAVADRLLWIYYWSQGERQWAKHEVGHAWEWFFW